MVESRSMVRGASPDPAPACQARASNSRLTRSSWRTWPHRKLRRKVPRVDGALTVPPRVQAVPPVRKASASSMQSPPARAEATRVISLSPVLARPGARPQIEVPVNQLGQAKMLGQGRRKDQTGVGHQTVVVEGDPDAVGTVCVVASIGCSFSGVGFLFQNHYPRSTGVPSCRFRTLTRRPPSVDSGLGSYELLLWPYPMRWLDDRGGASCIPTGEGMFKINNTRKHFLPQFYLRGFCRQDKRGRIPHIYVFDKKAPGKGIQSRSIEKVEVSKDAYSIHIDEFNKRQESAWGDIFKHLIATITTELNELIADREQSAALRAWLADFATTISLRSRGLRERFKETSLENWNSLRREISMIFEEMDDEELAKETGASKEEIKRILAQFTHTDDYEKWLAVTIRPSRPEGDEVNRFLEKGSWRFENPPGPRKLILSDIPSTLLRLGPEYPNWIYFQVPINETLLLIGHCGDARLESGLLPGSSQMSEEMIDLRNSTTLEDSEQFVFSSSKDEIIRAIEQTRDGSL